MATLNYEEFLKKYVFDIGGAQMKEVIQSQVGDNADDLEIIDMIMESVGQSFYQDYLEGKLEYIEEEDKPDNNNK